MKEGSAPIETSWSNAAAIVQDPIHLANVHLGT